MKRSRFTEEQIIAILHEQEAGVAVADLCRKHGLSSPTFCKWKAFGGLNVSEARRLKALEDENAKLKRMLAPVLKSTAAGTSIFVPCENFLATVLPHQLKPSALLFFLNWRAVVKRNIWMGSIAFAAVVLAAGVSQAGTVTIDFTGHTNGTAVGSTYASDGLTFSGAYFEQCGGGCPPPNPLSGSFAAGSGSFTADFATPQDDITFQSVSFSSTLAQAYNASNVLVASATDNQGFPINDQVDVLSGPDIAYVVFSYDGGYNGPAITNLTFDASAVPEPATWASMILGLFGVGAMLRSRRKLAGATAVA